MGAISVTFGRIDGALFSFRPFFFGSKYIERYYYVSTRGRREGRMVRAFAEDMRFVITVTVVYMQIYFCNLLHTYCTMVWKRNRERSPSKIEIGRVGK